MGYLAIAKGLSRGGSFLYGSKKQRGGQSLLGELVPVKGTLGALGFYRRKEGTLCEGGAQEVLACLSNDFTDGRSNFW